MSASVRTLAAIATAVCLLGTAACTDRVAGRQVATAGQGSGSAVTTTSTTCTEGTLIADPWIAFEPPLEQDARLAVGQRGWLSRADSLDGVTVTGTRAAVELSLGSVTTGTVCGEGGSRVSWIEVEAVHPGTVTIARKGVSGGLRITVFDA